MDQELQDHLSRAGVAWDRLDESARVELEASWRRVYGRVFQDRPRGRRGANRSWPRRRDGRSRPWFRDGAKADHEYRCQSCGRYVIVPFSADVPGLPVHVYRQAIGAYECRGPLIPLGAFCDAEFFIGPPDLTWAMIHTHEDHALAGPYFIRAEWVAGDGG